MEIRVQQTGTPGHVVLEGDMTIYTAAELKEQLLGLLDQCSDIELDLSGVTEIDTAGQQLLVLAKLESLLCDKPLRLVRHSQAVVDVIDLCGLAGFFGDPILIHSQSTGAAS